MDNTVLQIKITTILLLHISICHDTIVNSNYTILNYKDSNMKLKTNSHNYFFKL